MKFLYAKNFKTCKIKFLKIADTYNLSYICNNFSVIQLEVNNFEYGVHFCKIKIMETAAAKSCIYEYIWVVQSAHLFSFENWSTIIWEMNNLNLGLILAKFVCRCQFFSEKLYSSL